MGGISFGYFDNGVFQTDGELPFINQVTTIRIDPQGRFTQYLMDAEYPVILSTGARSMAEFVLELWAFMKERKKFWLLPIVLVLVLVGTLLVLTQGSAVAPFIYTLF